MLHVYGTRVQYNACVLSDSMLVMIFIAYTPAPVVSVYVCSTLACHVNHNINMVEMCTVPCSFYQHPHLGTVVADHSEFTWLWLFFFWTKAPTLRTCLHLRLINVFKYSGTPPCECGCCVQSQKYRTYIKQPPK